MVVVAGRAQKNAYLAAQRGTTPAVPSIAKK
jgi:hypothetical protein